MFDPVALFLEAVQLRLFLLTCCCKLPPPWLCFDGKVASNLWGSCNRKGILPWMLSASNSAPLPFLSQIWHSNDSFILMWHNQLMLGGLCGGRHHLDLCQSRTCIVWAILFVTIPWYFPGSLLPYRFPMQWVVILLVLCLPVPVLCQTNRQWLKRDVAVSGLGAGCTISSISQLSYVPLLAQWKSCVLQAVAHDYVNQCALVTSQARSCSGRPAASGRHYPQKCITFMGEEGGGMRGRDTNFVICVCLSIVRLFAWTFLGFMKSEPAEVYSIVSELR